MKKVRTRYAPSPTGFLHIGGARTALFSYLFAKHYGGDFILRIEDTDVARNVEGGEASQIDNLEWLGIKIDESPRNPIEKYGPYRQSEKLDRYNAIIDELLEKGHAYKAYETSEELEVQRNSQLAQGIPSFRYKKGMLNVSEEEINRRDAAGEYVIRIALPVNKDYTWNDIVRGSITVNTSDIGDFVIRKRDGYPTYNFAVVVDDHDMEITHVLRGEEHTTNTPKQMAIYELMGWDMPEFGHLTIITNMEGKKLSKRDTETRQFIEDYRNDGYPHKAIFNFLSILGWTHPEAKEVLSHDEIIEAFDEKRFVKSPSKFNMDKMDWFAKEYIKSMEVESAAKGILYTVRDLEWNETSNVIEHLALRLGKTTDWIKLFLETYKKGMTTFRELYDAVEIYVNVKEGNVEANDVVKRFKEILYTKSFSIESIQEAINETKEQTGAKGKELFMPIRLATTLEEHGPELAKAIYLFGENVIKARLGE